MSRRNTPVPSPPSGSKTPSVPASASGNILVDNHIRRIAVDPSAVLGSFYDATTESVVGKLSLSQKITTKVLQHQDIECQTMKADTFDREDLFRKIGIHEEPWLNSILNMPPAAGITSVVNYEFPQSMNSRFLYYYYSSEEQSISQTKNTVLANIPKENPDLVATHVISAITLGVQVLIVLELPSDDETNLDSLLQDIALRLYENKYWPSGTEKARLDRIIVTKVFSNISPLNNLLTLSDICQKIIEIRPHVFRHQSLEFTLRTMRWFYPSYPYEKARYTSLEPDSIKMIKQYLDSLSSQIKQLKTSLDSIEKQTREKSLKEQYDELRQRVATIEGIYQNEIDGVRHFVIQIRSGSIEQESVDERLSERFTEIFKNKIEPIKEHLESLTKKVNFIKTLDTENIKYLNMQFYFIRIDDDLNRVFQKLWTDSKPRLIFCSTDELKVQNSSTWHDQYMIWMQERDNDPTLTLVYADFSYTSYPISRVKILSMNSSDAVKKQAESSTSPIQLTSSTSKLSADIINLDREVSQAKQPTKSDEQSKRTNAPTTLDSEASDDPDSSSKEVKRPSSSSTSSNKLTKPQPTPRKTEQSEKIDNTQSLPPSEERGLSNDQINYREGQDNPSLPTLLPNSQTVHQDAGLGKTLIPTSTSKSSAVESLSVSGEQQRSSSEHNKTSVLPPLLVQKDAAEVKREQSKSSSPPTPSTPVPVEASNKPDIQGERIDREATLPAILETARRSSPDSQQVISINERPKSSTLSQIDNRNESLPIKHTDSFNGLKNQPRPSTAPTSPDAVQERRQSRRTGAQSSTTQSHSDINLELNQDKKDKNKLLNESNSSMQNDKRNGSVSMEPDGCLDNAKDQIRPSSAPVSRSIARRKRRSGTTEISNATQSSDSSTTGNMATLNGPKNDEEHLSHTPKLFSPRARPQKPKDPASLGNMLEPITTPEPSSIGGTSITTDEQSEQLETTPRLSTPDITRPRRPSSTSSQSRRIKHVNVLLLGESGVGKSTFINALVNYLAFETLEQARSNQPPVAMPVSFLMTVGDQFEEKIVQFGIKDPNEDHDHPGQSVTQHCRSYVFLIGTQTDLRIIDTPGMGDTRGFDQDDQNMEHILAFINNLPHLNAICILLKPNESRLKVTIRSYFTRVLNFLGENARNNIVFCFTNTRATGYTPGNTASLLKKMLNDVSVKDIPFGKRNTFCFDSKVFRYLVARQNGILFNTNQEEEYQQSWTKSSKISKKLIQYICGELVPYSQDQWQSIEHAQFTINQLIRPMLETIRNILRNITLLKEKSSKFLIKLCPIALSRSSALCYECPRIPQLFSDFWILPDIVHRLENQCKDCVCGKEKHIDVVCKLDYQVTQCEYEKSFEDMNSNCTLLKMAILEFAQFYAHIVDTLKQNDPMLSALKQIIAEEDQICSGKGDRCLNITLHKLFNGLRREYEERRSKSISIHLRVDLPNIYEHIRIISEIDEVKEQIRIIQQAQRKYLKTHEKRVS